MDVYLKRIKNFKSEAAWLKRSQIPEIDDEKSPVYPKSPCYKIQLAVQLQYPRILEPRYWIDDELWSMADEDARAGLVVHEIVFTDVIFANNKPTSDGVRMFNALISSQEISKFSSVEYWKFLSQYGLDNLYFADNGKSFEGYSRQLVLPFGRILYNNQRDYSVVLARDSYSCNGECYVRTYDMTFKDYEVSDAKPELVEERTDKVQAFIWKQTTFPTYSGTANDLRAFIAADITFNSPLGVFTLTNSEVSKFKTEGAWLPADAAGGPFRKDVISYLLTAPLLSGGNWLIPLAYLDDNNNLLMLRNSEGGNELSGPNIGEFKISDILEIDFNKTGYPTQIVPKKSHLINTNLGNVDAGVVNFVAGTSVISSFERIRESSVGVLKELNKAGIDYSIELDSYKNIIVINVKHEGLWSLEYNNKGKTMENSYKVRLDKNGHMIDPKM